MGDRKVVRESESQSVRQDWYSSNGDVDSRQQFRDQGREGQHGGGCGCCSCGCATKFQDEFQRERVGRVDQSQGSWRTDEVQRGRFSQSQNSWRTDEAQRFNQSQNSWRTDEVQRDRFSQSQNGWRTEQSEQGAYAEGYRRGYETAHAESQACFGRKRSEADNVCDVQTNVSRLTYDDRDKRFTPLYQSTHEIARQRVMAELQKRGGLSLDGDRNCQPNARGGQWQDNSRRDTTETRHLSQEDARYQMRHQEEARRREQEYLREQEARREQEYRRNLPEGCFNGGRSNQGNDRAKKLAAIVGSIILGGQPRTEYFDEPRRFDDFCDPSSSPVGRTGCNDGVPRYSQWGQNSRQSAAWEMSNPNQNRSNSRQSAAREMSQGRNDYNSRPSAAWEMSQGRNDHNSRPSAAWEMSYPGQDSRERQFDRQSWAMQQAQEQLSGRFHNDGSLIYPRRNNNPGLVQDDRQNFPGSFGYRTQSEIQYDEYGNEYGSRRRYPATEQDRKSQQIRQWTNLAGSLFSKFNH